MLDDVLRVLEGLAAILTTVLISRHGILPRATGDPAQGTPVPLILVQHSRVKIS